MANPLGIPHIKRFQFLGVLGTGAQGLVVLARDHADASSEPVGLKVLRSATDAASADRLREEARILAWLSHPNIVRGHRLLEKDGLPILVMEHVQGASAQELIGTGVPLPEAIALEIAHRTALALDYAFHAPGSDGEPMRLVHGDIEPGNLLLSVGGEVKLVDFGAATRADAATPAADVFSLGCTLYRMLRGQPLVTGSTADEQDGLVARALTELAPRDEVRALIIDMCSFEAARRPPMAELAQRLAALVGQAGRPDLATYVASNLAPIVAGRARKNPRSAHWSDLAFLEAAGHVRDAKLPTSRPRRNLALRSAISPDHIEPMLAVLQNRPVWAIWRKKVSPEALVAALVAMRGTRDPRAVTRANEFTNHADPRVVEAAWDLLSAALGGRTA